jgi:hypothetical protein
MEGAARDWREPLAADAERQTAITETAFGRSFISRSTVGLTMGLVKFSEIIILQAAQWIEPK